MGTINKIKLILESLKLSSIAKSYSLDFAGDDVVLVSGSGRSGTSWLANICNYKNDFRYIFEPLNPAQLQTAEANQWCLPVDNSAVKNDPSSLRSAIEGTVSNKWVNSRNRKFFSKRRLVKEIRSNFMLQWIKVNYPNTKIVLITRNPLAIAASRKFLNSCQDNSKWLWQPELSELLQEPVLRESLDPNMFELLSNQVGKGIVLETVADWCINNLVSLSSIEQNDYFHVYYESLVSDGASVCKDLMDYIGVEYESSIEQALNKSSETTRSAEVLKWGGILTESEVKDATQLLDAFGVDRLYTSDWQPVVRA